MKGNTGGLIKTLTLEMGCVGLIRIISRISRTLLPSTVSQRQTENASRIGFPPPPPFPCSHFYLHYDDDNCFPAKLFFFPSRTVFRLPTSRRSPTGRSGLCFCINMVFLQPRAGVPPVPRSGESRRVPRASSTRPPAPITPSRQRALSDGSPSPVDTRTGRKIPGR